MARDVLDSLLCVMIQSTVEGSFKAYADKQLGV